MKLELRILFFYLIPKVILLLDYFPTSYLQILKFDNARLHDKSLYCDMLKKDIQHRQSEKNFLKILM